jgi:nicotinate phosphoribosyltransferase
MTVINSLIDTDLYKFTMAQAVFHQFSKQRPITRFKFKCRNANNLAKYVDDINAEFDHLCTLGFQRNELDYLSSLTFLSQDFIDFLEMFRLKRNYIKCWIDTNGELQIECDGPWIQVIFFEVFALSIVQEVWTMNEYPSHDMGFAREQLNLKIEDAKRHATKLRFNFADFGTRRRFSYAWQREVVQTLSSELPRDVFTGTSNVLFAMEFGVKPIGTMAHEYLQAGQALGPRLVDSQKYMLEKWVQEYRGELGIALSDVVGFDAFLVDFDKYFAKLYDGCRHDSGDPAKWCDKLIAHYVKLGIDPTTKTAVFSDGLDMASAMYLAERFRGRINTSFGIGTNLTNDVGVDALQVVMKMVECNGSPVAKISDSAGKGMCEDPEYLTYLKKVFKIPTVFDKMMVTGKKKYNVEVR